MRVVILQAAALVSATTGFLSVSALPSYLVVPFLSVLSLLSIMCGWVSMIQARAVRYVPGFRGTLVGHLVPIPSKWSSPLSLSPALPALLVSTAALFGAALRMLSLAYV